MEDMDLKASFAKKKQKFYEEPYMALHKRKFYLKTLKSILQKNATELTNAVSEDFSYRAPYETLLLDLFPAISAINYCLWNLKKWTKKRKRKVSWLFKPAYAYLFPQPLGVIGILVPWNYPIFLSIVPLAYAIAAGNRAMVKMSELTPNTGLAISKLLNKAGFPSEIVDIINGDVNVSKDFVQLPFNHMLFTGSASVGKQVMNAASDNLTPVTLELGGKSPAIISKTVNWNCLTRLLMGKLLNAGQTCLAPDYLAIPKGFENLILKFCQKFIEEHYQNLLENQNYSSIISDGHLKRLKTLLEDCQQKGGELVKFGVDLPNSRKLPFYLLFNVNHSMQVMKEEIFGPILPVITYDSLTHLTDLINSLPNPLSIYYFGSDLDEQRWLEYNTRSGGFTVNDTITQCAINDLPFGGVGNSGMGKYHGREGFDIFSNLKPVFIQKRFTPITWLYPPHGIFIRYFLRLVAGIRY